MIQGHGPVMQAFLGTLFTWGLTAAGAALVIIIRGSQRKLLDASLGFAAGVMTAASYWSLLSPAIEMAEESKIYGENGEYAFAPVAFGFLLGALFVYGADVLISVLGVHSPNMMLALHATSNRKDRRDVSRPNSHISSPDSTAIIDGFTELGGTVHQRRRVGKLDKMKRQNEELVHTQSYEDVSTIEEIQHGQWKRIILLVIAITVHNIPEGLAVGVGFGAIGSSNSATFESARNLAIGIGIQNFPEGLAVSLPLQAAGFSTLRSFWYGQLSGMVEPIFGVLGAVAVALAQPALPYALSFAAGAMIYVVVDDIIPEANTNGNGKLATWGAILGFLVMMTLDAAFFNGPTAYSDIDRQSCSGDGQAVGIVSPACPKSLYCSNTYGIAALTSYAESSPDLQVDTITLLSSEFIRVVEATECTRTYQLDLHLNVWCCGLWCVAVGFNIASDYGISLQLRKRFVMVKVVFCALKDFLFIRWTTVVKKCIEDFMDPTVKTSTSQLLEFT